MSTKTNIRTLTREDVAKAYEGSYYFIAGTGGDLQEWVNGYNGLMRENEIGEPVEWLQVTGAVINLFALDKKGKVRPEDQFPDDLTCLMFPLDDLAVGRLAIFKLQMQDRWFDDVIDNMRSK